MRHVMIDLETLGTAQDAAIISIGACVFWPEDNNLGSSFYRRIDWDSALIGRSITASTLKWWMAQQDGARLEVIGGGDDIERVLNDFKDWLPLDPYVWGNGSAFDITILSTAYKNDPPWNFRNVRDMRTIAALGVVNADEIPTEGVAHNALSDAVWQAKYVCLALHRLKNKGWGLK